MPTRINPLGWDRFLDATGRRFSRVGVALQAAAAAKAPVRRGHRSFDTSPGPLGGTLRDSIAYAVILDGTVLEAPSSPGGGVLQGLEEHAVRDAIVVVCGTTTAQAVGGDGYGLWVNSGTSKMEPRPFMEEAFDEVSPQVPQLVSGR
jgi:hypothetical protein